VFSTNIGICDWKTIVATLLVVLAVAFVVLLLLFRRSRSDLNEVMFKVDRVLNDLQTLRNSAGELVFLASPIDLPDSWYSKQVLDVLGHWQCPSLKVTVRYKAIYSTEKSNLIYSLIHDLYYPIHFNTRILLLIDLDIFCIFRWKKYSFT